MGGGYNRGKKIRVSITLSINLPQKLISLEKYLYGNFVCCRAELIHYAMCKLQYSVLRGIFQFKSLKMQDNPWLPERRPDSERFSSRLN
jgi:hypothetical protein